MLVIVCIWDVNQNGCATSDIARYKSLLSIFDFWMQQGQKQVELLTESLYGLWLRLCD